MTAPVAAWRRCASQARSGRGAASARLLQPLCLLMLVAALGMTCSFVFRPALPEASSQRNSRVSRTGLQARWQAAELLTPTSVSPKGRLDEKQVKELEWSWTGHAGPLAGTWSLRVDKFLQPSDILRISKLLRPVMGMRSLGRVRVSAAPTLKIHPDGSTFVKLRLKWGPWEEDVFIRGELQNTDSKGLFQSRMLSMRSGAKGREVPLHILPARDLNLTYWSPERFLVRDSSGVVDVLERVAGDETQTGTKRQKSAVARQPWKRHHGDTEELAGTSSPEKTQPIGVNMSELTAKLDSMSQDVERLLEEQSLREEQAKPAATGVPVDRETFARFSRDIRVDVKKQIEKEIATVRVSESDVIETKKLCEILQTKLWKEEERRHEITKELLALKQHLQVLNTTSCDLEALIDKYIAEKEQHDDKLSNVEDAIGRLDKKVSIQVQKQAAEIKELRDSIKKSATELLRVSGLENALSSTDAALKAETQARMEVLVDLNDRLDQLKQQFLEETRSRQRRMPNLSAQMTALWDRLKALEMQMERPHDEQRAGDKQWEQLREEAKQILLQEEERQQQEQSPEALTKSPKQPNIVVRFLNMFRQDRS